MASIRLVATRSLLATSVLVGGCTSEMRPPPSASVDSTFTYRGHPVLPGAINAYIADTLGFTSQGGRVRCAYRPLGQEDDRIFVSTLCLELVRAGDSLATGSGRGGPVALRMAVEGDSVRIVGHDVPVDGGGHAESIRRIFPERIASAILAAPVGNDTLERHLRALADRTEPRGGAAGDPVGALVEARVPRAVAGEPGWLHAQRATADFDGDGRDEALVIISDAELGPGGGPIYSDGHRWQVYVEEPDGARTYLYARFLPNGMLTARVGEAGSGGQPTIVLLEQTPFSIAVYELGYTNGGARVIARMERRLDVTRFPAEAPRRN